MLLPLFSDWCGFGYLRRHDKRRLKALEARIRHAEAAKASVRLVKLCYVETRCVAAVVGVWQRFEVLCSAFAAQLQQCLADQCSNEASPITLLRSCRVSEVLRSC